MAGFSSTDYVELLQSLLPIGKAWSKSPSSVLYQVLHGMADELARIDERALAILKERNTVTTSELLIDHERDLGLPDECAEDTVTIQERRAAAHSKTIQIGGQNKAYFIDIAAALGYTITITEYTPMWCGLAECDDPIGDQESLFYWTVNIDTAVDPIYFLCGNSESGDALITINNFDTVGCLIEKHKPAHTVLDFVIVGDGFATGFNNGFDALPFTGDQAVTGSFNGYEYSLAFDLLLGGAYSTDAYSTDFNVIIP